MGGFKMNMSLSTTRASTNTPAAPTVVLRKMGATTKRNCAALNIQGNKYCKSCSEKK
ncbi:hypothetical protein PGAG_00360 [Phaeocystis globosa virus 12T]|uniref:Uncharacterized protein n=1 Tax=Phaeocystis globosa virus PgV-16T TaxID=3071227 RepID=A0AC59EXP9_9VIRU|nr:hypothetical protein PGCG_00405 [Phaeocystis globosa virus]AET73249.1 hypothetical protein PGAG_00360 [Phaeocystis globosa virus 12T]AET73684.1 hypothetical protein PGBG_00373 [Phaeocystis globosa virus 14T]AGM15709.1 hypothetical protein PGCG_00405 [Phaeocystis globosa virus PgV-16T]UYE94439.1 hypothetical protein PGV14T_00405 [Phaeocystis globosa virus]